MEENNINNNNNNLNEVNSNVNVSNTVVESSVNPVENSNNNNNNNSNIVIQNGVINLKSFEEEVTEEDDSIKIDKKKLPIYIGIGALVLGVLYIIVKFVMVSLDDSVKVYVKNQSGHNIFVYGCELEKCGLFNSDKYLLLFDNDKTYYRELLKSEVDKINDTDDFHSELKLSTSEFNEMEVSNTLMFKENSCVSNKNLSHLVFSINNELYFFLENSEFNNSEFYNFEKYCEIVGCTDDGYMMYNNSVFDIKNNKVLYTIEDDSYLNGSISKENDMYVIKYSSGTCDNENIIYLDSEFNKVENYNDNVDNNDIVDDNVIVTPEN